MGGPKPMEDGVGVEPHHLPLCLRLCSPETPPVHFFEKRPPTHRGPLALCYALIVAPSCPLAITVRWSSCRFTLSGNFAAGGGCGRICAQGGARAIYSCMGVAPPFRDLGLRPLGYLRISWDYRRHPKRPRPLGDITGLPARGANQRHYRGR